MTNRHSRQPAKSAIIFTRPSMKRCGPSTNSATSKWPQEHKGVSKLVELTFKEKLKWGQTRTIDPLQGATNGSDALLVVDDRQEERAVVGGMPTR